MDEMIESLVDMFVEGRALVLSGLDAQITYMRETPDMDVPEAIELLMRYRMENDEMLTRKIESLKLRSLL